MPIKQIILAHGTGLPSVGVWLCNILFQIGVVRCYFEASLHFLPCEGEFAWASEKIVRDEKTLEIFQHLFMSHAMKWTVKYHLT